MKRTLLVLAILGCATAGGRALPTCPRPTAISRIGGSTLDEIENELNRRGPQIKSSGRRHPGATQMQFTTKIGYAEARRPLLRRIGHRHGQGQGHPAEMATLQDGRTGCPADLGHAVLRHQAPRGKPRGDRQEPCARSGAGAEGASAASATARSPPKRPRPITAKILARHDRAQQEFDRVEGMNFESRIMRLLALPAGAHRGRPPAGLMHAAVRPRRASSAGWSTTSCTGRRSARRG